MEKIYSDDLKINRIEKPFITKKGIILYRTRDNQVAKFFSPKILDERGEEMEEEEQGREEEERKDREERRERWRQLKHRVT